MQNSDDVNYPKSVCDHRKVKKFSQLAGSLASREKSLKLLWLGFLSRPPCVNLKFLSFFLVFEGERRVQNFLVPPQWCGSFSSVFSRARWCNWRLRLLWVVGVVFENICTVSGKWNITRVVSWLYGWVHKILRLPPLLAQLHVPNLGDSQAADSMRSQFLIPALWNLFSE